MTLATLAVAMSAVVISAVTCVALTKDVVRELPFHCTTDDETKFVPFTCKVNPAAPVLADDGERALTAGTGLGIGPGDWDGDEPPHPDRAARTIGSAITALPNLVMFIRSIFVITENFPA